MPDHPLLPAALAALVEPMREADLATALGLRPASDEALATVDELVDTGWIVHIGDGRVASVAALVDGLVLWHRVDSVEVAMRRVSLGIDLLPVLAAVPVPTDVLVGDAVVPLLAWLGPGDPDIDRGPTVQLPDGWGSDLAAGDLVAVTVDGLQLRLHRDDDPRLPGATAPTAGHDEAARFGAALARMAETHGGRLSILRDPDRDAADQWVIDIETQGRALLADHAEAVRALHRLPLREAIVRAGCTHGGCMIAGPAVTSRSLQTFLVGWTVAAELSLDQPFVLEACGVVTGALTGSRTASDGEAYDPEATHEALRTLLRDPLVSQVIVEHMRRVHLSVASEAERRIHPVHVAHPTEPGPAWLRATLLLRQGRGHDARDILDRAVAGLDDAGFDDWPLLVRTAARMHAVAGELPSAIRLLRRSHWAADAAELTRWRPDPPKVGRNERCACGSGRKAKVCCQDGSVPSPTSDRLSQVWHRLVGWALDHDCGASVAMVLASRAARLGGEAALRRVSLAFDVHLLEGGGLGAVLDEVGALLPAEELDIAVRWRVGRHGLWVVDHVDDGTPVWRDALNDARARIVGVIDPGVVDASTPPGTHLLAAVLPAPVGHVLAGPTVEVPANEVLRATETVMAGTDLALLALLWDLSGVGLDPEDHVRPDAA